MSSTLISLFKDLVLIDSVSGEEKELALFVFSFLHNLGLSPRIDNSNMVYCRIGKDLNPILLCAHMDTVEPGRGVQVEEVNGYLKSNGKTILGGDNKVSLAAILESIRRLVKSEVGINVELLFTVREETDSGIQNFDTSIIESKVAFVFDGGGTDLGWCVVNAAIIEDFKFELIGKASHASRPEQGVNALNMFLALNENIILGRLDPDTTFNIGTIDGGNATNTVPDRVVLSGDLRSFSKDSFEQYKHQIISYFNESAKKFGGKLNSNWISYSKGYSLDMQSEYYKKLKILYKENQIEINPVKVAGGSDANFLNEQSIVAFCLGDGVEDIHTVNERIKIDTFVKLQSMIEKLILHF